MQRRNFMRKLGGLSGAALMTPWLHPVRASELKSLFREKATLSAETLASDEDFWFQIRQAYAISPNFINLNNGGVSPHPRIVQEAVQAYTREANEAPAYYLFRSQYRMREAVRRELAELAGCTAEEISLQLNTTEAITTVLQGIDWKVGDEVVTSDQVYPSMKHTLMQLEARRGITVRYVKLPGPEAALKAWAEPFEAAMGDRTRLVLICHVINLSGQILPVRQVADAAHAAGAEILVDGAHSFAQLDFKIPDLNCDYFATSLHKWLCAPFGTGMLYVKQEKIPNLWPLMGAPAGDEDKISKFEHHGTRSYPTELAIGTAIDFHNGIGSARKEARLRYLKDYWISRVKDLPGFKLNTSLNPEQSCGIANFAIEGKDSAQLGNLLTQEHQLYNTVTSHPDVKGVRISPNVYTSLKELEYLVEVLSGL